MNEKKNEERKKTNHCKSMTISSNGAIVRSVNFSTLWLKIDVLSRKLLANEMILQLWVWSSQERFHCGLHLRLKRGTASVLDLEGKERKGEIFRSEKRERE